MHGNFKHGLCRTRLYAVWEDMINRCENPNHKRYKDWGGRGISVCPEWHNFIVFRSWALEHGYKYYLQIDRIDNSGNYTPENCRFATRKEQARNSRWNRHIKIGDEIKLLCEWAELYGINRQTLSDRINAKWPESKLLVPARGALSN